MKELEYLLTKNITSALSYFQYLSLFPSPCERVRNSLIPSPCACQKLEVETLGQPYCDQYIEVIVKFLVFRLCLQYEIFMHDLNA